MDTQVRSDNQSVAFVEQLWREYCQELQSSADKYGHRLSPEVTVGAARPAYYDFIALKLLEQLSVMSHELLQLPDGVEQLAARLAAMQRELDADYRAPLYQRADELVARGQYREQQRAQQSKLRWWRLWK